jgi:uncharacterized protein (TIGR03000 family)
MRPQSRGQSKKKTEQNTDQNQEVRAANRATVVVTLPTDARLTVSGQPTQSVSSRRVFTSPPLQKGMKYFYTFKASVVRDGRTITTKKRVRVRPGEVTRVSIAFRSDSLTRR